MQQDNLQGSLLMVLAMAAFTVEDVLIKAATVDLPVGQVLILFGLGGMALFAALVRARGERVFHPAVLAPRMLLKAAFEVTGRLGYTLAIALTPLSSAASILQATPLVVVAGAALIFGERVGWRRWLAISIGFLGVLVILRPGLDGFRPASIWALVGMVGFAGRDLATRAAPKVLSNLQLGVWGFAALIPAGVLALAVTGGARMPDATGAGLLLGAVLVGVGAYYALTAAMRRGEVSVVTPFRYTRLVFSLLLAALVFGERPDLATLAGGAIIIGSGVYTLLRARALARAGRA